MNRLSRLRNDFGKAVQNGGVVAEAFVKHDIANLKRVKRLGFGLEILNAVSDRRVHNRILVGLERDVFPIAFEQILINAAFLIENSESRGQPLRQVVDGVRVQAFVVHALDPENDSDISTLREEDFIVHKSKEIHLRAKRCCFAVFLCDSGQLKHGGASAPGQARISLGRTVCEFSWSSARTGGFAGRSASPIARRSTGRKTFPPPRLNYST